MRSKTVLWSDLRVGDLLVLADLGSGWRTPVESEPMPIVRITDTRVEVQAPGSKQVWGIRVDVVGELGEVFVLRDHAPYIHRNTVAVAPDDGARVVWDAERRVASARTRTQAWAKKVLGSNPDLAEVMALATMVAELATEVERLDNIRVQSEME